MWLILALSIVAVGVFLERIMFFHRNSPPIDAFLSGITNLIRRGQFDEALTRCDDAYGPAVRVVQASLLKRGLPKAELREVVQEVAQMQVPRLEANLPLLATIAQIAPLLGLLGTVMGMMHAFMQIDEAKGAVPVGDLSASIWEALITTAGGLVVAIPCYVAYNFLASRVQAIIIDMERCGIEVIQLITLSPQSAPPSSSSSEKAPASGTDTPEKKAAANDKK